MKNDCYDFSRKSKWVGCLIITCYSLLPKFVFADNWETFGKQEQMIDHLIVDVGNVTTVSLSLDPKKKKEIYRIGKTCFVLDDVISYSNINSKAGILLLNDNKDYKLALIDTAILAIKVDLEEVTIVDCISSPLDGKARRNSDLNKKIEEFKKLNINK